MLYQHQNAVKIELLHSHVFTIYIIQFLYTVSNTTIRILHLYATVIVTKHLLRANRQVPDKILYEL